MRGDHAPNPSESGRSLARGLAIVAVTALLTLAVAVLAGRAVGVAATQLGFLAALLGGISLVLALTAATGTPGSASGTVLVLQLLRGEPRSTDGQSQVVHATVLLLLGVFVGGVGAILLAG